MGEDRRTGAGEQGQTRAPGLPDPRPPTPDPQPFRLEPQYHERVWGGQRLRPATPPVGEAWIVYEHNRVVGGAAAGRTLAEVAAEQGEALLGRRAVAQTGTRFPLLIKLLDTADWLSVQVHPNDEQAVRLEGPGHAGKTEAWHMLAADPGARLICGLRPGTTRDALAVAIRDGTLADLLHYQPVGAGDTILMRAGTLHALGPGLLLYEVQQTSDITYRVFDWNRPATAGRALHIEQSLAVVEPAAVGQVAPAPAAGGGAVVPLTTCEYFTLTRLAADDEPLALDPAGESFHALTVIEGAAEVAGAGWRHRLTPYETLIIPAAGGRYTVQPRPRLRAMVASTSADIQP